MKFKKLYFVLFLVIISAESYSQLSYFRNIEFTERDSLRGELTPIRECYDVSFYELTVKFDLETRSIKGSNDIHFKLLKSSPLMQVDLFENLHVESVRFNKESLSFTRYKDAIFIDISDFEENQFYSIIINYYGSPKIAQNPPWDGGFIWQKDNNDNPWIHVSCQGIGASLWWPNKDHLSDEPDSMQVNLIVPYGLMAISNGALVGENKTEKNHEFQWKIQYPINNYNVSFSIGDYHGFQKDYISAEKGKLRCDYYVLPENVKKAKKHFRQVNKVLEAFEFYLGPYPFWKDGYSLIETPYLGMEHQSAIAYGNKFQRGYLGGMLPEHMNWDYIIVHETAHEYWGNAVSAYDHAEIWIHEAFATYMEALFVEYHFGREESVKYLCTQRNHKNHYPIIGPENVNYYEFKDDDHYFKGSWVLHTLRNSINDDDLFFKIIKNFYDQHKYKNASSDDFFTLVNNLTGEDYSLFFRQYLYHPQIPILEYRLSQKEKDVLLEYRWNTFEEDFSMKLFFLNNGKKIWIQPSSNWDSKVIKQCDIQNLSIASSHFLIDAVYVKGKQ